MRQKAILLFLAAAIAAALAGCTGQPMGESSSGASPPQPESPSQQPEKTYTYYECVEPLKGLQPQHIRWEAGDGFSVRQKDTILFVDADNELRKTFRPVDREWPDSPWELSTQDWASATFCEYTWNQTYVLARFNLYGSLGAMIAEKDGRPTIADAAIYNMEGQFVKTFPSTYDPDVKARLSNEKYAWMVSNRTRYDWLEEDILAINTGEAVWLYSVSRDELKQAADYSQELLAAWHREESYNFGIQGNQCWVADGKLYYAVGHGLQSPPGEQYTVSCALWSVGWDSPAACISGDRLHHEYQVKNGMVFAADYHLEQVGADTMWVCDLERLDGQTGEYIAIGTGGEQVEVATRQDLIAYTTYRREAPDEPLQYTLHCQDLQSGEEQQWQAATPEAKGNRFITLLDVGRHPGGVIFYYYVEDMHETGRTVTLAAYDTATGQAVFAPVDSLAAIPPGAGAPSRFLETDMEGRVRMRPLP